MWNRQTPNRPLFRYDAASLEPYERQFLLTSGEILGAAHHLTASDRDQLRIDLLSEAAMKASAIEGEMLDQLSVQSSLRKFLGLAPDGYPSKPREQGASEMMMDVCSRYSEPLSHDTLFRWHDMLLSHNRQLDSIGTYRSYEDATQTVSGGVGRPRVQFEAPPSHLVLAEMDKFITWFNRTAPDGPEPLRALARTGLSYLSFEIIHPFEVGNGQLGRALVEKSLAQCIGQPSLIALAFTIEQERKAFNDQLEHHQKSLDVTPWLMWFAEAVLAAQQTTLERIGFFISKTHFYQRHRDQFNARQNKVIGQLFKAGPNGFKGGLSAENYLSITGTSRATATRDLHDLVKKGALIRTGELRYTRYWLKL